MDDDSDVRTRQQAGRPALREQMLPVSRPNATSLRTRAEAVLAGFENWARPYLRDVTSGLPRSVHHADGAIVTDVDGNTFVDLVGAYGPDLLGHRHPRVERAASRQHALGDSLGAPAPVWVDLAEHLGTRFEPVDWVFVGKNGSDTLRRRAWPPTLAWYLCAALTDDQIGHVLDVAVDAFAEVADEFARPTRVGGPPALRDL